MSKKWRIAIGVIAVVAVVGLIAVCLLGRWMMFRTGRVPFGRDFGPRWGERFERDFGPGRPKPFGRGIGPGHGVPFAQDFGPGRGWHSRSMFGPFAIVGGLVHLGFFALLIGLSVVVLLRCCQRGGGPAPGQREGKSEPDSERPESNND